MAQNSQPITEGKWPNGRVQKSRYNLPDALEILKGYGCTQTDLGQFLFDGELRGGAFPYRKEPDRFVPIETLEFKRIETWGFSVFANHIDGEYVGEELNPGALATMPLSMVPDAVDEEIKELKMRGVDANKIVGGNTVYILHKSLEQFVSRKFYKSEGAKAHTEINKLLNRLIQWIEDTAPNKNPEEYKKENFFSDALIQVDRKITEGMFKNAWRQANIPEDFKKPGRPPRQK